MKIIVCVKQVPDTNQVKINPVTGTLIRDGVPSIINPDDKNALEEAIRLKALSEDVHVTVLCMGPPQAKDALREALAMGADDAVLLSDRAFGGSDTYATATILAAGIRKIGDYDLVLCGRQAIDGDTAQVGPQIAEFLGLPQVSYVEKLEVSGRTVLAHRATEEGYYIMEAPMPVLLTAIKELNVPRYPHMAGIHRAFAADAPITVWGVEDVDVDLTQIGVRNSPTNVYRSFTPFREFHGETIEGSNTEIAEQLIQKFHALNLV